MKQFNNTVIVQQQEDPIKIKLFSGLLLLGAVMWLVINYWWALVPAAAVVAFAVIGSRRLKEAAEHQRQLLADAYRQDSMFLAGDPRGVYGDNHEGSQQ